MGYFFLALAVLAAGAIVWANQTQKTAAQRRLILRKGDSGGSDAGFQGATVQSTDRHGDADGDGGGDGGGGD